ncbi:hypothetical protein BH20ACI4_BH20ACI4_20800 [soil metagenome]
MAKNCKTFNEILREISQKNSEQLMKKARLANFLAKRLRGKKRAAAYRVKSNALCSLVKKIPNRVRISKDLKLTEFIVVELRSEQSGLHLPVAKLTESNI